MKESLFITFEGPEGAGKTSVLKVIGERLKERSIAHLLTREPGGIEIAEKIRAVILDPSHTNMDERTEALLFAAARAQHFFEKVQPALQNGQMVLCDRFIDSSLAYQGYARNLGVDEVLSINEFAIGKRLPDLTLLFDLPPAIGLERIQANRSDEINRLDQENISFHERVREGYLKSVEKYPNRIKVINANQSIDKVVDDVWSILAQFLDEK